MIKLILASVLAISLGACGTKVTESPMSQPEGVSIAYEKHTLDNGLDVIFHIDKSDPIVSIALAAKVGSGREKPGRTGFAHLFEHLLFLDSENLGFKGLDRLSTRIGGSSTNGYTTNDITTYYQSAPSDALEKLIWAESEKVGYFIKTVSQDVINNEREVVKNEKRESDNQPYGFTYEVIEENLYPADHPYNWQIIGSLEHLQAATLDDVHEFYRKWYVPNNVTVSITGDFDPQEALRLVEKYFGEIPRGADIAPLDVRNVTLDENKLFYHEDRLANLPALTMVWPTVPQDHPDAIPLMILAQYLSEGKEAPLNTVLKNDLALTTDLYMYNDNREIAGMAVLGVTANSGVDVDSVLTGIQTAFDNFNDAGISEDSIQRIKTTLEVDAMDDLASTLDKAIVLAENNVFYDDPGHSTQVIQSIRSATQDDVRRVFNKYVYQKPYLATSFVPKGQVELALENSVKADVDAENLDNKAGGLKADIAVSQITRVEFEPTASSFDRSIEPPLGDKFVMPSPNIWTGSLSNQMDVYGVTDTELPLVNFTISIEAGRAHGDINNPAVPSLMGLLMEQGTQNKTPGELEQAFDALGSSVDIRVGMHKITIRVSTLARNFEATVDLIKEMVLEPRWDEDEFDEIIQARKNRLARLAKDPEHLGGLAAAKIIYPEGSHLGISSSGTLEQIENITIDDLKLFYSQNFRPSGGKVVVVGDVRLIDVKQAMSALSEKWTGAPVASMGNIEANPVTQSNLYVYHYPGETQTYIQVTRPSISATHPDYPLLEAINFSLGGTFTSQLSEELRTDKGYTYGISSDFTGSKHRGVFEIYTSVRRDVTVDAMASIKNIMQNYIEDFSQKDLDLMKAAIIRNQALQTETLGDKLDVLHNIANYNYPPNYLAANADVIQAMTLSQFKETASKYLRMDEMNWFIIGDVKSDMDVFETLGFDNVITLNE